MEFLVTGASAVQIGTANYFDPTITMKILDGLPAALASLQARSVAEIVGTLRLPSAK
jgi:dihydroorotate dehydrogenase (NAD+) catalytic subunit